MVGAPYGILSEIMVRSAMLVGAACSGELPAMVFNRLAEHQLATDAASGSAEA